MRPAVWSSSSSMGPLAGPAPVLGPTKAGLMGGRDPEPKARRVLERLAAGRADT
jgi:hypothetical protein